MKSIGIIGGFGPEATARFYLQAVEQTRMRHHGRQPQIILRNVSVDRKLEHDALIHGRRVNEFLPLLTAAAEQLEQDGAECIVLPCNTLHVHEKTLRSSLSVPFVSIIQATTALFNKAAITRVGILGSRITIRENLFKKQSGNITFISVPKALQERIDSGLDVFVETGNEKLLTKALEESLVFFATRNVQDILLACTDFHGLCVPRPDMRFHDTLDILVRATVDML